MTKASLGLQRTGPGKVDRDKERAALVRNRAFARSSQAAKLVSTGGAVPSDHLLALQQTAGNRAVQRLLASGDRTRHPGSSLQVQRRLKWNDTDKWRSAKYLDASGQGAGGVLFVGEDQLREVVVKPGQEAAEEGALAALLHSEVAARGKFGIVLTPGVRVATPEESGEIKAALEPLVDQAGANAPDVEGREGKQFKKERARKLVDTLNQPGLVVQDVAKGTGFDEAISAIKKHTKKGLFGRVKLHKESPMRIFKDRRSIEALGMNTAVDLFTGNKDRFFMWNAQNFMVTPYSISMIDNVFEGGGMADLKTRGNTADSVLAAWKRDPEVKRLAQSDYASISKQSWEALNDAVHTGQVRLGKTHNKQRAATRKALGEYEDRFNKYFCIGLAAGKKQLMQSLDSLINDPSRLQRLMPGTDLSEIITTIRKRRDFLSGQG